MARTLASVQKVVDIQPIPGADKIVHAQVLGWKCITAIDNGIKAGDLVVYFEIDSRLNSEDKRFGFMESRKWKVKTIKMRGVYSQGLIMPLDQVPEIKDPKEGLDVTELLKVTKIDTYEPGESGGKGKKQHPVDKWLCRFKIWRKIRPFFIKKKETGWDDTIPHTDETRIQALYYRLQPAFETKRWYSTVKIDGQSGTFSYKHKMFGRGKFNIYSRSLRKKEGDGSNWDRVAQEYAIRKRMEEDGRSIWIQGEVAGPGIQKNKDKLKTLKFFVFNVYLPEQKRYMSLEEMMCYCECRGFDMVPIVEMDFSLKGKSIDELVELSKGKSTWNEDALREGIVIRERDNQDLSRISFKVINPEFLVKYNA